MTANSFEVVFRFDGNLADEGELDGSDHEAATRASRRLLALHAHCFLHGKVPSAAQSEGRAYHVRHVATQKGSHADYWNVVINNAWAIQIAGLIGTAYADEVKLAINAAARFLRDSVRSAVGMGSKSLPEIIKIEPVLETWAGNRQPMIDTDAEHDQLRLHLRQVTIQILHDIARPVGRSASRLTILIDGHPVVTIDEQMKREWLQDQIAVAVAALRQEQQGSSRVRLAP